MSAEEAMNFVRERRPHVSLGENQRAAVSAFETYHYAKMGKTLSSSARPTLVTAGKDWAVSEEDSREPTAIALKQKPRMMTWPTRFVAIRGKRLLVFDFGKTTIEENQAAYAAWLKQQEEPVPQGAAAPSTTNDPRTTSIDDLTDCRIVKDFESFTFSGTYFKMSVFSKNWDHKDNEPELPGFNVERNDKEAFFAFQAEYDCERFVAAATNIAAGRDWNVNEGVPPVAEAAGGGAAQDASLTQSAPAALGTAEPEPESAA